ncbi:MAG: PEP-utilizing enzyme [Candidatus Magasanikbacteria bacterium]
MIIKEIQNSKFPSFTEWFEAIEHDKTQELREEDNSKRDRLEFLWQNFNIPYDRPERMTARDIIDKTQLFQDIIKRKGDKPCALRLVPTKVNLPKLRQRGKTLDEYINNWFYTLGINPDDYKVEVVPHSDETKYSATFIITDSHIYGELVKGGHWQLTQGFFEHTPTSFIYDFQNLQTTTKDEQEKNLIMQMINLLIISKDRQNILKEKFNSQFTPQGYLKGYFEYVIWPDNTRHFVDYNRLIPKIMPDTDIVLPSIKSELQGICASPGRATGKVKKIEDPAIHGLDEGDVLVCTMTTMNYVPLMKKASAIITVQGNILSHAAIISRELKKPCVVNVSDALQKLKNGDKIDIDAKNGTIKIIKDED